MAQIGVGTIPITFDKAQIGKSLSAGVEGGAKASEGSIAGTFKRLAGIATAAFGAAKVFGFVSDSIDEARESNKVAAQTEAVIKSTGGAAKLTAGDFSELADSISAKTGIDDEAIQTAENLLATFTNVREEVGAGNDIFSQATQVAVDMGAALGGDAASNSILLGKALNDPIRGLTALTRVGVTFDDGQREQIKTMQEHGDILGAQKIILGELNKEFGGSAEATATAGDKFSVFWGNVQEGFGKILIPLLDSVAEWAMTTLPNAFGVLQDAIGPIVEGFQEFWTVLTTGFTEGEGGTAWEDFAFMLRDDVWPIVQKVFGWMKDNIPVVGAAVIGVLVPAFVAWAVSAGTAAAATIAAAAPFVAVSLGVAALAAGLVYAYQNFDGFRAVVDAVASWLRDTGWPIMQAVFAAIVLAIQGVITFVQTSWPYVQATFEAVFGAMQIAWDTVGHPIFDFIVAAAQVVIDWFGTIWSGLSDAFGSVFGLMQSAWDIGSGIFTSIVGAGQTVIEWFKTVWGGITEAFGTVFGVMQSVWDNTGAPIFAVIQAVIDKIVDTINVIIGAADAVASALGLSAGSGGATPDNYTPGYVGPGGYKPPPNARMAGGPVNAYGDYVVGERGPELLRMGSGSGWITPNHALTGGGGSSVRVEIVGGPIFLRDKRAMAEFAEAMAEPIRRVGVRKNIRNPAAVYGLG